MENRKKIIITTGQKWSLRALTEPQNFVQMNSPCLGMYGGLIHIILGIHSGSQVYLHQVTATKIYINKSVNCNFQMFGKCLPIVRLYTIFHLSTTVYAMPVHLIWHIMSLNTFVSKAVKHRHIVLRPPHPIQMCKTAFSVGGQQDTPTLTYK